MRHIMREMERNAPEEQELPKFDWKSKVPDAGLTNEQKQRLELLQLVGVDFLRQYFDIPSVKSK